MSDVPVCVWCHHAEPNDLMLEATSGVFDVPLVAWQCRDETWCDLRSIGNQSSRLPGPQ